tara:strand:- start:111 stop:866 length:756 start_codon:yes stop_codon:yes gene_type:complete
MDLNLSQAGLLLLLITASARILLISIPLIKFVRIFDRKIVEGGRLIGELEIPGLKLFIRHEVILGFIPYLILFVCMELFNLSDFTISDLDFFIQILAFTVLLFWLAVDWWRSFSIYEKLTNLYKETDKVRTISGSALDGLRFAVHIRGTVRKTVVKLGFRALVGVVKGKLKRKEAEDGKTPTGTVAISLVDRLISFPERITGKLTDWVKGDLDNRLMKKFTKYADRSPLRLVMILLWSLVPSVVLTSLTFV